MSNCTSSNSDLFTSNLVDIFKVVTNNHIYVRNNRRKFVVPDDILRKEDKKLKDTVYYVDPEEYTFENIAKVNLTTEFLNRDYINHIYLAKNFIFKNKIKFDGLFGAVINYKGKYKNIIALLLIEDKDTQGKLDELKKLHYTEIPTIILIRKSNKILNKYNFDTIETNIFCLNVVREIERRIS